MLTFMFLFFTQEKPKALMFLANKIKGFDVLCSYFFELQSLYVLIWPCSYKKKDCNTTRICIVSDLNIILHLTFINVSYTLFNKERKIEIAKIIYGLDYKLIIN